VGSGAASKDQVKFMVAALLSLPTRPPKTKPTPSRSPSATSTAASYTRTRRLISYIKGTLVEKTPARIVVEAGGIGHEISIPLSSYDGLGSVGSDTVVYTHFTSARTSTSSSASPRPRSAALQAPDQCVGNRAEVGAWHPLGGERR